MTTCSVFDWSILEEQETPNPLELFARLPVGDNGEPYDIELSPWAAPVFDWWLDSTVEWIHLIQGSQTSKTVTMLGLMMWCANYDPDPAMWVGALEDEVDSFVVDRLKPFLEAADARVKTGKKTDWRKTTLRLYGKMRIHAAWATSARRLRSWPIRYLFGDEVGIWPASLPEVGDPLEYLKKRTRRFRNRKGIFATTPGDDNHPSWQAALAANFARWFVPCPECGEFQYLAWKNIAFDHCRVNGRWDLGRIARETFYRCEHCQAEIANVQKASMIAGGRLQYVNPHTGEQTKPEPGNRSRTLQIPATYSLFTPWGELAKSFVLAKQKGSEALRIFVTDELAEPWKAPTDAPELDTLRRCIDTDRARGVVPSDVIFLTCGVDVQLHSVYYVVRAWSMQFSSYLVAHGMLPLGEFGLNILDDVIDADYDGNTIAHTFIDSGAFTDSVYAYATSKGPKVSPCKGIPGNQAAPVKVADTRAKPGKRRRRSAGEPVLYLVAGEFFKGFVHDHIGVQRGDPGEWRLHADVDDDYCKQILSEARQPKTERGRVVYRFQPIAKHHPNNHYLDAEVYASACARYPLRLDQYTPRLAEQVQRPAPRTSSGWVSGKGKRGGRWLRG